MSEIILDNVKGKLEFGFFGTFSERIRILFDSPHPIYGKIFMTKYYSLIDETSCYWGNENNILQWEYIDKL